MKSLLGSVLGLGAILPALKGSDRQVIAFVVASKNDTAGKSHVGSLEELRSPLALPARS